MEQPLLFISIVATLLAGTILLSYIATHPPRLRVGTWRGDDLPAEEICFMSCDGLALKGWFVPAQQAKGGIILCHGYPANRTEMLPEARLLHEAGFHVLLFDFRALGDSEGRICTLGNEEVLDLTGALDYLVSRQEMQGLKLGVLGLSMGGAVSIITTALDTRIHAVATHGAFATLERAIYTRVIRFTGPFSAITAPFANYMVRMWLPPERQTPYASIAQIAPRPLLIVHGSRDKVISPEDAELLFEQAQEPKQKAFLPNSYHVGIHPSDKETYNTLILDFFMKALA